MVYIREANYILTLCMIIFRILFEYSKINSRLTYILTGHSSSVTHCYIIQNLTSLSEFKDHTLFCGYQFYVSPLS